MLKELKKRLKKSFIKVNVLETYEIDGETYKVIDRTSALPFIKDIRSLSFKKEDGIYSHSSIYLNPKYHIQPIFNIPQKIILAWSNIFNLKNALVLGCAGCSFPRFLSLHYPQSKTLGVELSKDFVEIAKKYFLLDQLENRFELIQDDAIEFVKTLNPEEKNDIIFVDIFNQDKIIKEVFSEDFIMPLYNATSENSMIIINSRGETVESLKEFLGTYSSLFKTSFILGKNDSLFLALTRCPDSEAMAEFIVTLKHSKEMDVIYMA